MSREQLLRRRIQALTGVFILGLILSGAIRGIPVWWRLIDCSFSVFGIIPLWLCRRWVNELESRLEVS
jgi:hypothetical protein